MAKTLLQKACLLALGVLFMLSLTSLTSFPTAFDDEGFYGAYGAGYIATGKFVSPSILPKPPFTDGNAWNPRLNAAVFGGAGLVFGYHHLTARAVSFAWIWIAVALWYFIARELGMSGAFGALLFASAERVFYASHVFRPESAEVLLVSILIWLMVRRPLRELPARAMLARGLFNAPLVLAHGNGVVSALLNTVDCVWRPRGNSRTLVLQYSMYAVGTLAAILIFYSVQIQSVGGWDVAKAQLDVFGQYHVKRNILASIIADIKIRWGLELIDVGGSPFAKALRFVFYGTILATSIHSIARLGGLARRLGAFALASAFGYMVIVPDKIDIHIAEMVPYFLASLLAWYAAVFKKTPRQVLPKLVLGTILGIGPLLSTHHALKYRGPTSFDRAMASIDRFLSESGNSEKYRTMVAPMHFWFRYHDRMRFLGLRYAEDFAPFHGYVLTTDAASNLAFKNCRPIFVDPEGWFTALQCP